MRPDPPAPPQPIAPPPPPDPVLEEQDTQFGEDLEEGRDEGDFAEAQAARRRRVKRAQSEAFDPVEDPFNTSGENPFKVNKKGSVLSKDRDQ